MNSTLRSGLVFLGLLVVVVLGSVLYSRSLERTTPPPATPQPNASAQPVGGPSLPAPAAPFEEVPEDELRRRLEQLERVSPDQQAYSLALNNRGVIYSQLGEPEASLEMFTELARLQFHNPDVLVSLAWAQYSLGQYGEAELTALRALALAPTDPRLYYSAALYRLAQGSDLPAVITTYHRAISLDTERKWTSAALGDLTALAQLEPELADVHYALAYFSRLSGSTAAEADHLQRYLASSPEGATAEIARRRLAEVQPG